MKKFIFTFLMLLPFIMTNSQTIVEIPPHSTPSGCTSEAEIIAFEINVLNADSSIAAVAYIDFETGFNFSSDNSIVIGLPDSTFSIIDDNYTLFRTRVAQRCKIGCCNSVVKWTDWDGTTGGTNPPTIDTNDDVVTDSTEGETTTVDVTDNDTSSDCEPITYVAFNEVNCVVVNNNDGTFDVTPIAAGPWSFDYTATCDDGTTSDTSTVSGNADDCDCNEPTFIISGVSVSPNVFGTDQFQMSFFGGSSGTTSSNVDITVDWGDGSLPELFTGVDIDGGIGTILVHDYTSDGLFTITYSFTDDNGYFITGSNVIEVVGGVYNVTNLSHWGMNQGLGLFGRDVNTTIVQPDPCEDSFNVSFNGVVGVNNGSDIGGTIYLGTNSSTTTFTLGTVGNTYTSPTWNVSSGIYNYGYTFTDDLGQVTTQTAVIEIKCDNNPAINTNDDVVTDSTEGQTTTVDVTDNDTSSDCEPITYVAFNEVNCVVVNNNDGTFDVTPTTAGPWSFDYTATCDDGTTNDTSTVSGNADDVLDICDCPNGFTATSITPNGQEAAIGTTIPFGIQYPDQVALTDDFGNSPTPPTSVGSFTIDWGDGTQSTGTSSGTNILHVYSNPGVYVITLTGVTSDGLMVQQQSMVEIEASGGIAGTNASSVKASTFISDADCPASMTATLNPNSIINSLNNDLITNADFGMEINGVELGAGNFIWNGTITDGEILEVYIYAYSPSGIKIKTGGQIEVNCNTTTPTIDTNDDVVNNTNAGQSTFVDVTDNDTSSDCEPITYVVANEVNCTVVNNNNGTFNVTPIAFGPWSFDYTATCSDGTTSDTSNVSGVADNEPLNACQTCGNDVVLTSMFITPAGYSIIDVNNADLRISAGNYNGTGSVTSWLIDWGDGNQSSGTTWVNGNVLATNTYISPGIYFVTLSTTSSDGETMQRGHWVQVDENGYSFLNTTFGNEVALSFSCPDATFNPMPAYFHISGTNYPANGVEARQYINGVLIESQTYTGGVGIMTNPFPNTVGTHTIRVEFEDSQNRISFQEYTYTLSCASTNPPSITVNDDITAESEAGLTQIINVTSNDSSSDCEPITYTVSNEINCTVVNNGDGTFDYTPTFGGVWSFEYTATCSDGITSDIATVSGNANGSANPCPGNDFATTLTEDADFYYINANGGSTNYSMDTYIFSLAELNDLVTSGYTDITTLTNYVEANYVVSSGSTSAFTPNPLIVQKGVNGSDEFAYLISIYDDTCPELKSCFFVVGQGTGGGFTNLPDNFRYVVPINCLVFSN